MFTLFFGANYFQTGGFGMNNFFLPGVDDPVSRLWFTCICREPASATGVCGIADVRQTLTTIQTSLY